MAHPDLSETLPDPIALRRLAIISFIWDGHTFNIACTACILCRASDEGSDQELDWVHCNGYQVHPGVPMERNPSTARYLIPAEYIVRIAYGGRFTVANRSRSPDVAVFPPIHQAPLARIALEQIRDELAYVQAEKAMTEPYLYKDFVREASLRFGEELSRIRAEYNFDFGHEFEIAVCKTLRMLLPQQYGICRGHVVSAFGDVAGDDIVVYDRMRFPTLRGLEQDRYERKERIPIEAVFAYIEAKHTLDIKGTGDSSIQKAWAQVGRVKALCSRRPSVAWNRSDCIPVEGLEAWPDSRNPVIGIILSRQVRIEKGSQPSTDANKIAAELELIPLQSISQPDFCIVGPSNLLMPVVKRKGSEETWAPSPFFVNGHSSHHISIVDGIGFGVGISMLMWALGWVRLGEMPWAAILEDCIPPSKPPQVE